MLTLVLQRAWERHPPTHCSSEEAAQQQDCSDANRHTYVGSYGEATSFVLEGAELVQLLVEHLLDGGAALREGQCRAHCTCHEDYSNVARQPGGAGPAGRPAWFCQPARPKERRAVPFCRRGAAMPHGPVQQVPPAAQGREARQHSGGHL